MRHTFIVPKQGTVVQGVSPPGAPFRLHLPGAVSLSHPLRHILNGCEGEVRFIIPEGGISSLDAHGQPFWDPAALSAFIRTLESTLQPTATQRIIKVPNLINDPGFALAVIEQFRLISPIAK